MHLIPFCLGRQTEIGAQSLSSQISIILSVTTEQLTPVVILRSIFMTEIFKFKLNDEPVSLKIDSDRMLLWVLRTDLGLTGTKYGCGEGICGSCTVLINDKAFRSCLVPVKDVNGQNVTTIEGLAQNDTLHPLQKAFIENDACQCGFCTPGMILTAYSFLKENPNPSESDIISGMDANLCRCGSHIRIIKAIQDAAAEMRSGRAK